MAVNALAQGNTNASGADAHAVGEGADVYEASPSILALIISMALSAASPPPSPKTLANRANVASTSLLSSYSPRRPLSLLLVLSDTVSNLAPQP